MLRKPASGELAPRGADKVQRYKWTLTGEKPSLEWVKKDQLGVDDEYQRNGRESVALSLAREWSWPAVGALIVVRRRSGQMVVVDGQHRWLAACRRSDIQELPCCVFNESAEGLVDEARSFVQANTNRKAVRSNEMLKARALAGDPAARRVVELVESIGRHIGSTQSGKSVACVTSLMRCVDRDSEALTRIWPLVAQLCEGKPIHDAFIVGLHLVEHWLHAEGASITQEPWVSKIHRIGCDELLRVAKKSAMYREKGGLKSWGLGMAIELNKGMRTNRIPVPEE